MTQRPYTSVWLPALSVITLAALMTLVACCPSETNREVKAADTPRQPASISTREQFEVKLKCSEMGRRFAEEWAKGLAPLYAITEQRFIYDTQLNTCVCLVRGVGKAGRLDELWDVVTNTALVAFDSTVQRNEDKIAFEKRRAEIFGE